MRATRPSDTHCRALARQSSAYGAHSSRSVHERCQTKLSCQNFEHFKNSVTHFTHGPHPPASPASSRTLPRILPALVRKSMCLCANYAQTKVRTSVTGAILNVILTPYTYVLFTPLFTHCHEIFFSICFPPQGFY